MGIVVFNICDRVPVRNPQPRTGSVHSVFATSFNVELSGELVHVGTDEAPLSYFGMTVGAKEMAMLVERVEPGDAVHCRDGVMRIYSRADVSELVYGEAAVRSLAVPHAVDSLAGADVALLRVLTAADVVEHIGLPWPDRSRGAVAELARFSVSCARLAGMAKSTYSKEEVHARYEASERAMRGGVEYLLGRGLGLTPSGDDVLCGFGCALHLLYGTGSLIAPYLDAVRHALPGRTTAVSEAYLRAMTAGCANEDFVALAADLTAGEFEALPDRVGRIFQMGHTSGADSLLGFGAAFGCLF